MAKELKKNDALRDLLAIAPAKVLTDLILHLVAKSPDIRRICLDFLKTDVSLTGYSPYISVMIRRNWEASLLDN